MSQNLQEIKLVLFWCSKKFHFFFNHAIDYAKRHPRGPVFYRNIRVGKRDRAASRLRRDKPRLSFLIAARAGAPIHRRESEITSMLQREIRRAYISCRAFNTRVLRAFSFAR